MAISCESANFRAKSMLDIIATIVHQATGITPRELKSETCRHEVTKARFLFVSLCSGVVSPLPLVAEYLNRNVSMMSYYRKAHDECYDIYTDFRVKSDMANDMFNKIFTNINETIGYVFQREEGEQVQC
jgi:hypothetical protein